MAMDHGIIAKKDFQARRDQARRDVPCVAVFQEDVVVDHVTSVAALQDVIVASLRAVEGSVKHDFSVGIGLFIPVRY